MNRTFLAMCLILGFFVGPVAFAFEPDAQSEGGINLPTGDNPQCNCKNIIAGNLPDNKTAQQQAVAHDLGLKTTDGSDTGALHDAPKQ